MVLNDDVGFIERRFDHVADIRIRAPGIERDAHSRHPLPDMGLRSNYRIRDRLRADRLEEMIKFPSGSRNSNDRFPHGWVVGCDDETRVWGSAYQGQREAILIRQLRCGSMSASASAMA